MHATRISPPNPSPRHATGEHDNIITATALIRTGTLMRHPKKPAVPGQITPELDLPNFRIIADETTGPPVAEDWNPDMTERRVAPGPRPGRSLGNIRLSGGS